jgi:hypothetical protein
VTTIAKQCAILEISVDTWQLFNNDEPYYEMWLDMLAQLVNDHNRSASKK